MTEHTFLRNSGTAATAKSFVWTPQHDAVMKGQLVINTRRSRGTTYLEMYLEMCCSTFAIPMQATLGMNACAYDDVHSSDWHSGEICQHCSLLKQQLIDNAVARVNSISKSRLSNADRQGSPLTVRKLSNFDRHCIIMTSQSENWKQRHMVLVFHVQGLSLGLRT